MCGIFGFSGSRPVDVTKLRWLAVENESRGRDSTGVYGNHLYKDQLSAKRIILLPGFNAAVKGCDTVIGHTRAASYGFSVSKDNAHPFKFGVGEDWEVVGTHNGFIIPDMIPHHTKDLGFEKEFPVDSMLIFAALHKYKGDLKVISQIEGAMALAFVFPNHDPKALYLYRRKKTRDLHIGEASDGLYYSSESTPLEYIGCKNIFEVETDVLYTLREGKIVDMYNMPTSILKDLASNVKRADWRLGIPTAQLNALPAGVGLLGQGAAPKSSWSAPKSNQSQMALSWQNPNKGPACGTGELRRMAENHVNTNDVSTDAFRTALTDKYSGKDSSDTIKNKYQMLIKSLDREIKVTNAEAITEIKTVVRDANVNPDFSDCLMAINLKNKSNGKGLIAWAVMLTGHIDISGLTSPNGFTILKIPHTLCHDEIELHVYDPVDMFGHFTFKIKPEAARVMEVALSIPFRKKRNEETSTAGDSSFVDATEAGDRVGRATDPENVPASNEDADNGTYTGSNLPLLRQEEGQVSGGHQGQQDDGAQAEQGYTTCFISDPGIKPLDLAEKKRYLLPSHHDKATRDTMINYVLPSTPIGTARKFNWNPQSTIFMFLFAREGYKKWDNIYKHDKYKTVLSSNQLLGDALRLQCWDKQSNKACWNIEFYIELLLKIRPLDYINQQYEKIHPYFMRESLYPSNIMKVIDKNGHFTTVKKKRSPFP